MLINLKDISLPDEDHRFFKPLQKEIDDLAEVFQDKSPSQITAIQVKRLGPRSYQLITGYRRYKAAEKLGWTQIEATLVPDSQSEEVDLLMEIDENLNRHQITWLEKAEALVKREEILRETKPEMFEHKGGFYAEQSEFSQTLKEDLNVSRSSMSEYRTIINGTIPELKQLIHERLWEDKNFPHGIAYWIARQDQDVQKEILDALRESDNPYHSDISHAIYSNQLERLRGLVVKKKTTSSLTEQGFEQKAIEVLSQQRPEVQEDFIKSIDKEPEIVETFKKDPVEGINTFVTSHYRGKAQKELTEETKPTSFSQGTSLERILTLINSEIRGKVTMDLCYIVSQQQGNKNTYMLVIPETTTNRVGGYREEFWTRVTQDLLRTNPKFRSSAVLTFSDEELQNRKVIINGKKYTLDEFASMLKGTAKDDKYTDFFIAMNRDKKN